MPRLDRKEIIKEYESIFGKIQHPILFNHDEGYKEIKKFKKLPENIKYLAKNTISDLNNDLYHLSGKLNKNLNKAQIIFKLAELKKPIIEEIEVKLHKSNSAFRNHIEDYTINVSNNNLPLLDLIEIVKPTVDNLLEKKRKEFGPLKAFLFADITVKHEFEGKIDSFKDSAMAKTILESTDIKNITDELFNDIFKKFEVFLKNGSNWVYESLEKLTIGFSKFKPLDGGSYIELPDFIKNKKAVLNIKNSDNKCHMWSMLAALHPQKKHADRTSKYKEFINELKYDDIEFPFKITDCKKFEKLNPNISVNVYTYIFRDKKRELAPAYITEERKYNHVYLLLYKEHYFLIRSLSRLVGDTNKHDGKKFICDRCLHTYYKKERLISHYDVCSTHEAQIIEMPDKDSNIYEFKSIEKSMRAPFVIYSDFESVLKKFDDRKQNDSFKYQQHVICSFGIYVVPDKEIIPTLKELKIYDDLTKPIVMRLKFEDEKKVIEKYFDVLESIYKKIHKVANRNIEMIYDEKAKLDFEFADECYLCKRKFDNKVLVRDHNHITGKYRGAACGICNLNYKYKFVEIKKIKLLEIPIIFHNLRGYDSHLIINNLPNKYEKAKIIPNNMEKYMAFHINNFKFIDSLQFCASSLESLVNNLKDKSNPENNLKNFEHMNKIFNSDFEIMLRKGVYAYDYYDDFEKFQKNNILDKKDFYSKLNDEEISDEDYNHYLKVWNHFNIKNHGEYSNLYLKTDIILLADVFENFRNMCLNYYGLDPVHYYSAPGISIDAFLKMTKVKIELMTDLDMFLMIERGIRGGISCISHRFAKANNKYLKDFDEDAKKSFITYLDANNLYGYAMNQKLPLNKLKFVKPGSKAFKFIEENLTSFNTEGDLGFILECDLEYPEETHDKFSDYPILPEKVKANKYKHSPYSEEIANKYFMSEDKSSKLLCTLDKKEKYVIHFKNLIFALKQGVKLTKIHRIIKFRQEAYMKPYIMFNTEKRTQAKNDFEKDFFKLMNNACFGKLMENLRKRQDVKIARNKKQIGKLTSRHNYKNYKIIREDMAIVNLRKDIIKADKPLISGFTVLDLSKLHMFDFHYNTIKPMYGEKAKLLFTDTDSLCYQIETEDLYDDFEKIKDLFDFSEFDSKHKLYDTKNKKTAGKFKMEEGSYLINEFVGLRSKMYSVLFDNEKEMNKAKGVKKSEVKKNFKHLMYKNVLFNKERQSSKFNNIRSENHTIYTIEINKVGLSAYDNKRYILDDGITTLPYKHCLIN